MADFQKVLVKDDRLDVTDKIKYAVNKGGQNVTCAQFNAIAKSNSQVTFNIQVPSEQTIIDRRVLLKAQIKLRITTRNNDLSGGEGLQLGCRYGHNSALAPFPLHQLMSVASATINNNTVSVNVQDVLPAIMRLIDKEELQAYNGTTPTYQDSYYSYFDSLNNNNNPLGLYNNATDSYNTPRGSVRVIAYSTDASTNMLGSATVTEDFTFELTEPLLVSPFIFAHPKSNAQGFYGVQNLNFVFNLASVTAQQRVFRGLNGVLPKSYARNSPAPSKVPYISNVSFQGFEGNPQLLFTFLTPHPSDLMPARNVVPYYELPRYITQLGALGATTPYEVNGNQLYPAELTSQVFNSQSLQLNQIPDKLIVMVRKVLGNQTAGDADACLPIKAITINFNNQSGILASATREDLYRMTKDNCSTLNWYEFSGLVSDSRLSNQGNAGGVIYSNAFTTVPTIGSFLVLEFGKDIQLVEDFYAAGSLGNFNLQMRVTTENSNEYAFAANELEMVVITMNSGVFVNERGTSATYTGILTKADVLEASEQEAYTHSDVKRLVGGGFLDMVKSAAQKITPIAKAVLPVAKAIAPVAKGFLEQSGNKHAQTAASVLGALGMGASGGGASGGGVSGGRLGRRLM